MTTTTKLLLLIIFSILTARASQIKAQTEEEWKPIITLDITNEPLTNILIEIEKQSGFFFSYESSSIIDIPELTLQVKELPLKETLKQLFQSLPLSFRIKGRMIILKKRIHKVTISGFIRDQATAGALAGASVFMPATREGTTSNNIGFFSITLNPGDIKLQISYTGYEARSFIFPSLQKDTLLHIELVSSNSLDEVLIFADNGRELPLLSTQMGIITMDQQSIKKAPVMFGESDIIKALQLTPGVSTGTEGLTGFYVRGGNMDENLFQIDGNPVYQVNHLGGLFSAFNPEAVREIEFYKAGFPARYGGRLSSVVDVHTREGNMNKFQGSISVGLISGNLNLEGPIVKDKTSFAVSLRRSWLDILSIPTLAIINKRDEKYGMKNLFRYAFHDLNLRLNHKFNEKSRLHFSIYNGKDHLNRGVENSSIDKDIPYINKSEASLDWGNLMATASWNYVYNNRLSGQLSGVFTQYRSSIKNTREDRFKLNSSTNDQESYSQSQDKTSILDIGIRSSFNYFPTASHHVRFGGDLMMHRFHPEYKHLTSLMQGESETAKIWNRNGDINWGREFSLFMEDDWTISSHIRMNAGLRSTLFNVHAKTYMSLEPRLSLRWLLRNNLSTKLSYSRMNQYVHMVNESYISLPADAWIPVTGKLKPQISDQLSLGFYYDWKKGYDFSAEAYYKRLNNLLEYKEGYSSLSTSIPMDEKLTSGNGRAYGVEFMARKLTGKTTGWIAYTLSWADRRFEEINEGIRFPSRYDNRHKLNIFVSHRLSPKIDISAAWTFSSGNWQTLSLENYESIFEDSNNPPPQFSPYIDLDFYTPGKRNNYQLPNYHRLDLGMNIYRPKKNGRLGIWTISIYNAYSRMNPFMVYKTHKYIYSEEYTNYENPGPKYSAQNKPVFRQISILPIIPSISYTYKF